MPQPQVLAHQKQGPRATIGAARRALCYDGSEEPSPGPATYIAETKYKAERWKFWSLFWWSSPVENTKRVYKMGKNRKTQNMAG